MAAQETIINSHRPLHEVMPILNCAASPHLDWAQRTTSSPSKAFLILGFRAVPAKKQNKLTQWPEVANTEVNSSSNWQLLLISSPNSLLSCVCQKVYIRLPKLNWCFQSAVGDADPSTVLKSNTDANPLTASVPSISKSVVMSVIRQQSVE